MGGDRGLTGPYDRLAELAASAALAAADGDVAALERLAADWSELVAGLPPVPPVAAAPALERALDSQRAAAAALQASLAQARADLARLDRARQPVRAYGGPAERLVDAAS